MISRRHFLYYATATSAFLTLPAYAKNQTVLFQKIQSLLQECRAAGRLSADERLGLVVSDVITQQTVIAMNENVPLQAASMIKPLVIQAYLYCHFEKDAKLYPLNDKIISEMRAMIVDSNNTYTNYLIKRLGGPEGVQWMLRKKAPHIFRHIHIVESIPTGGKTYRNRVAASDYTRFLHALWFDQLPGSTLLKQLMHIKNHDRITVNTKYIPKTIGVYDKTGSTAMCCGNFGMIEYRTRRGVIHPYTFTAIIEKSRKAQHYTQWITQRSNVIRDLSDLVYLDFQYRIPE